MTRYLENIKTEGKSLNVIV